MSLATKIASLTSASADSASGASGAPPSGASGAESAPADPQAPVPTTDASGSSPAGATIDTGAAEREILAAKLAETRAKARARMDDKSARNARKEAEKLRDDAKSEKEQLSKSLRAGTFLETVKALGKDPREAFREMQAEAVRAGTPEAQLEAMQERFEAENKAIRDELQKERDERAARDKQTEEARQAAAIRAENQRFAGDFAKTVQQEPFGDLLDEYGEDRLLYLANNLRHNTSAAVDAASKLGVRLTDPARGVTMLEILSVLAAAQKDHESQKSARRTARTGATQNQPVPHPGPQTAKVNGTTAARNAEPSTIGNNIASATATAGKAPLRASSPSGRVKERMGRLLGR